jgi:hypothetical protein
MVVSLPFNGCGDENQWLVGACFFSSIFRPSSSILCGRAIQRMKLSTLSILLGLGLGLPQVYGLVRPAAFQAAVRKFPRSLSWGWALMLVATAWFVWNVTQESDADFAALKPMLIAGFIGVGIGSCVFVQDFLAARGLAVVFLLLAKLMVDTARWADSDWRWVVSGWAYVLVVAGMWFTISPYRLRDVLEWGTASDARVKVGCALRLAFGLFVAALGLTVF